MLGHVLDDSNHISYCDDACKFMVNLWFSLFE